MFSQRMHNGSSEGLLPGCIGQIFPNIPLLQALQAQLPLLHGRPEQAAATSKDLTEEAATAGLHGCIDSN